MKSTNSTLLKKQDIDDASAGEQVTRGPIYSGWSVWIWASVACVILGLSGFVRVWQDRRFATVEGQNLACPFQLNALPKTLGDDWVLEDGIEKMLDPKIAKVAGCSDSLIRTYRNATTGVSVTALVLFGPGKALVGHTPEVCYPAAGYHNVSDSSLRFVDAGMKDAIEFRSGVFSRDQDNQHWREEVYYSFRHGDHWSPDAQRYWKNFRHHPSMLKVQVQRPVSQEEDRAVDNPTEQFLALLLPEIERRLAMTSPRPQKG